MIVDSRLDFILHISRIVSHSIRYLGAISRLTRKFRFPKCLLTLYSALVRPRLEFASVIWSSIAMSHSNIIENVQRRLIRFSYDRHIDRCHFYGYNSLLEDLDHLNLHDKSIARDMNFLHQVVHGAIVCSELLMAFRFRVPSGR